MKRYHLRAGPADYKLTGSDTQGILGATYTGRSINVEGSYSRAKEWLEDYETSRQERQDLEYEFLLAISPAGANSIGTCLYRGRPFKDRPGSPYDFLPPPPDKARRQRYNAKGVPALYLSSSVAGVQLEITDLEPEEKLWTQRFRVVPELRLADARALPINSLAAAVFWVIESARDRSSKAPHLGIRIAQIIGELYDGLIVPGVRGNVNERYFNVVVFRSEVWHHLVDAGSQPEEASKM